jgi:hypothetical protein
MAVSFPCFVVDVKLSQKKEVNMADKCGYCGAFRPKGGTSKVFVNDDGSLVEFCTDKPVCGDEFILTNALTGETITAKHMYERSMEAAKQKAVDRGDPVVDGVDEIELQKKLYGNSA